MSDTQSKGQACGPGPGAVCGGGRAAARRWLYGLVMVVLLGAGLQPHPSWAVDAAVLRQLAADDFAEKSQGVAALVANPGPMGAAVLQALAQGRLRIDAQGGAWIQTDQGWLDAQTGLSAALSDPLPDEVMINNALRTQIGAGLAVLGLRAADRAVRLEAARALAAGDDATLREPLVQALDAEQDGAVRAALQLALAAIDLHATDPALRRLAVQALAHSDRADMPARLQALIERGPQGPDQAAEHDVLVAARASLKSVTARLERAEWAGRLFAGVSLGSILMLAAMGLAITYGLLGVINMAHGEMIMVGAYATYLTQIVLQVAAPGALAWYPIVALPVAFVTAALVGMLVERTVIRWLYGRPLETLLATWGVSLILIQTVRQLFGPQNVAIESPPWMSGGWQWGSLVLPYNRMAIIVFALVVLAAVAWLLARTRLGLFVRGVTQNRAMAAAVGVPTDRVDMLAFGLGSGVAGLAGVALSQVVNVGPELGQAYIIDSFIVVVLGGVGQLAGTVLAGLGLGVANKLMEPWLGAVIAKILILVLIIAFIQKRPSGLFALKGRAVEA